MRIEFVVSLFFVCFKQEHIHKQSITIETVTVLRIEQVVRISNMRVSNTMDRLYKLTFKKIKRIDVDHRYLVTLCYRLFQFFDPNQIRNLSLILIVKSMNTSIM